MGSDLVRCALAVWLGVLVGGCGHARLLCPRQAGPAWHLYESHHFSVTTDLPPSRARPLVGELERTYRSFVDVTGWHFPGRGEPPGRMRVIVFARRRDYDAVAPPRTDGFYRSESLEAESAVVINNDGTHEPGEVFIHELTHRLVRYYVPNLPLGLNEGLAEYFSTFTVRKSEALTGLPPRRLAANTGMRLPSIDTLFNAETLDGLSPEQVNAFYIGGWFLVHTMARYYPQQLGDLLAQLADGQSIRDAFFAAFGHEAWKQLGNRYVAVIDEAYHVQPGGVLVPTWHKPYRTPADVEGVTNESELRDGALHLLWADLQRGRHDVAAQVALAEAHGGDSAQLSYMRGLLHLQRQELPEAEREIAAAVDARPDDERYRLTRVRVHAAVLQQQPSQGLGSMVDDMSWLAAHAQAPASIALVAIYDALRGDLAAARTQVQRALAIDPTSAHAYYALAVVDAEQGDIDGALEAAERSLRLTPEGASSATAKALADKLRELRASRAARAVMPH